MNNYFYHILEMCQCRCILKKIMTDWLENRMENRAVGAHNKTIVCNFEESDGL